jgi:hypothetical protein
VLLNPHPVWLDAVELVELVLNRVGTEVVGKTTSATQASSPVDEKQPDLLTVEIDPLPVEPGGFEVAPPSALERGEASRDRALDSPRLEPHLDESVSREGG